MCVLPAVPTTLCTYCTFPMMNPLFEGARIWRYIRALPQEFCFFLAKRKWVAMFRERIGRWSMVRSNHPSTCGLICSCLPTRQPMQIPVHIVCCLSLFPSITTLSICFAATSSLDDRTPTWFKEGERRKKTKSFLVLFCSCFLALFTQRDAVNHRLLRIHFSCSTKNP